MHTEAWRQQGTRIITGAEGVRHVMALWKGLVKSAGQQVWRCGQAGAAASRCGLREVVQRLVERP